ncbi:MAG: hypothetical protein ACOCQ4_01705 [bacterium]
MEEKCVNCKYWKDTADIVVGGRRINTKLGECHRYPPTEENRENKFPIVMQDDWCGEFKK